VGQKEITIYNIHSKAGASKDNILRRRNEIEALKQLIRNDSNRQPIYMIAGDMNTKDKVELEGLITQL
jgi:protein involved in polysaccharide export with SLBB domain